MQGRDALFVSAMCTAVNIPAGFNPMADYLAAAMFAFGCERVNCTFKRIEIMRNTRYDNLQWFVVLVPANFTSIHKYPHQSFTAAFEAAPDPAEVVSGNADPEDPPD